MQANFVQFPEPTGWKCRLEDGRWFAVVQRPHDQLYVNAGMEEDTTRSALLEAWVQGGAQIRVVVPDSRKNASLLGRIGGTWAWDIFLELE